MCPGLLLSRGSRQPIPGFNFDGGSRGGEKKHPPQHVHAVLIGSLKRIPAALLFLLVGSADSSLCACSCPSKDWGSVVRAHISVCVSDFPVTRLTRRAVFSPPLFQSIMEQFNPCLRNFIAMGKSYEKALTSEYANNFLFSLCLCPFIPPVCPELQAEGKLTRHLGLLLYPLRSSQKMRWDDNTDTE